MDAGRCGQRGTTDSNPATGGVGEGVTSGNGGDGAAGTIIEGFDGLTLEGYGEGASGGGGGGAGRIRINSRDPLVLEGTLTPSSAATTTFGPLTRLTP